jgi:hypothetical protein
VSVFVRSKQDDESAESDQESGELEKMHLHGNLALIATKHSVFFFELSIQSVTLNKRPIPN